MDSFQFYATPKSLAEKAVSMFQRPIKKLLEPSAGHGDLLASISERCYKNIDCIEMDFKNVAVLEKKGFPVVGHDFLEFNGVSIYSHILLNPPFAYGVDHVLHAWDILFDGEIVAIINAETIKNPNSMKKKHLVQLIDTHGSVEFLSDQFMTDETDRQTPVEIALVHLEKNSQCSLDFLDGLAADSLIPQGSESFSMPNEISVPCAKFKSFVTIFDCAVLAAKKSAQAGVSAQHYEKMLGDSILDVKPIQSISECDARDLAAQDKSLAGDYAAQFNASYKKLKERAWSSVLRSSEVLTRLSSSAQKKVESDFERICLLEFTMKNIWGFLDGLIGQAGNIQNEMICDVFDKISRFHPNNHCYYQGWKSNEKHRVNAFRIMMTRFILPTSSSLDYLYSSNISWDDRKKLSDIDKVFAMLDGRSYECTYGIVNLFSDKFNELSNGQRLSCDYFDVRFYPNAGTFHFFPKRKDLIDLLNRKVGKLRSWLPEDDTVVSEEFWEQFEKAESICKTIKLDERSTWKLMNASSHNENRLFQDLFEKHSAVLKEKGIKYYGQDRLQFIEQLRLATA